MKKLILKLFGIKPEVKTVTVIKEINILPSDLLEGNIFVKGDLTVKGNLIVTGEITVCSNKIKS